ncbi:MAG TPA: hypothetical protein VGL08_12795, partial [Paraburkholderia sp.]
APVAPFASTSPNPDSSLPADAGAARAFAPALDIMYPKDERHSFALFYQPRVFARVCFSEHEQTKKLAI